MSCIDTLGRNTEHRQIRDLTQRVDSLETYGANALAIIAEGAVPGPKGDTGAPGANGINGTNGAKGDPGAGGNVAVGRAQLKTGPAAAASVGDTWWLSEDGRDGPVVMRAGTSPSDSDEAINVVVDATRYYARPIAGVREFRATWWLGNSEIGLTDVEIPLNRMFAQIKQFGRGAKVIMPAGTSMTSKSPIISDAEDLELDWRGALMTAVAGGNFAGVPMFQQRASGFYSHGGEMRPIRHTDQSGGGFAMMFSAIGTEPVGTGANPHYIERCIIERMTFRGGSEGFISFAHSTAANADTTLDKIAIPRFIDVSHCDFIDQDYQAISCFFCDDVKLTHNNMIAAPMRAGGGFTPTVRINSSRAVLVQGNRIWGPGLAMPSGDGRSWGVVVLNGQIASAERQAKDVSILGNRIDNCIVPVEIDRGGGIIEVRGNVGTADKTATVETFGVRANPYATAALPIDRLVIEDNVFDGVTTGCRLDGCYVNAVSFKRNRFSANARPANGTQRLFHHRSYNVFPMAYAEIEDNTLTAPDGSCEVGIELLQAMAGNQHFVSGNKLPSGRNDIPPAQAGNYQGGLIFQNGSTDARLYTSKTGNPLAAPGSVYPDANGLAGDNRKLPSGISG